MKFVAPGLVCVFQKPYLKRGLVMSDLTEASPQFDFNDTFGSHDVPQFFIWGSWYVAMYGFLNDAGMTAIGPGGSFDAAAYTVAPIAAILAPLTRFNVILMNTEHVLAILNIVGAGLLAAPSLASAGAPESF